MRAELEMQTSSQWNVLIGLFYFHINKMSPPLLFSSPLLLFCPLHFSQAVLSVDTLAPSLLPVNGSVNSIICSSVWRDKEKCIWMGEFVCDEMHQDKCNTGSWKRRRGEDERRDMKGDRTQRKVEISKTVPVELWQHGWGVFLIRRHNRLTPPKL